MLSRVKTQIQIRVKENIQNISFAVYLETKLKYWTDYRKMVPYPILNRGQTLTHSIPDSSKLLEP